MCKADKQSGDFCHLNFKKEYGRYKMRKTRRTERITEVPENNSVTQLNQSMGRNYRLRGIPFYIRDGWMDGVYE